MTRETKKGFTLVEIVAVVAILAIVTTIFAINTIKIHNQNKEEDYQNFINQVKASADAYVSNNKQVIKGLYESQTAIYIQIKDIKAEGYLIGDFKNPLTGEKINENEYVKITLGDNEELIFSYPA